MSKRPVTGVDQALTTPGSRWLAGHATLTAYTLGNRRRAAGSLAIPFWRHRIGVSGGATVTSWASAGGSLLALHRHEDHRMGAPVDLARMANDRKAEGVGT